MKKNFINQMFSALRCTAIIVGISFFCAATSQASTSSIIIDAKSGEILSSSGADQLRYPASLTKVMTLYITFDALEKGLIKMDDKLLVSRNAANRAPSKLGVRAGEKITVRDAIMALVIISANDCASVLAEGLGYSEENFAKTMTKVARELGMKNTTFKNASGLPNKAQKTTARDMAILGAAMYHHFPEHYKLFSSTQFTYKTRTYYTHNRLLKSYDGADGMKTGFTNASGYNIITSAQRGDNRVIAVTMGHNTAKVRDQKVATMMTQGLKKLASGNHARTASLILPDLAPVEPTQNAPQDNISETDSIQTAAADSVPEIINASAEISEKNSWSIQVGAFSNYAKARNYAMSVKKEISRRYDDKSVAIQPYQKGAAIIYRSQLSGFAKKEADNACNSLKRFNKSCIVIATTNDQLILANKF